MKKILIIAGPNGAGKTTFSGEFLPHEAACPEFVNADLIAAGLSPFQPDRVALKAGRLMMQRMRELAASGTSFAFETTLATRGYRRLIPQWRASGYRVVLHFLKLPDPAFAIRRVARRVKLGGHHIPDETVQRRFHRGWLNLHRDYLPLVNEWFIYDGARAPAQLLATGTEPPSDAFALMEEPASYAATTAPTTSDTSHTSETDLAGIEAALQRAAAKAIERDRAAGLEPVVTELHAPLNA